MVNRVAELPKEYQLPKGNKTVCTSQQLQKRQEYTGLCCGIFFV